MKLKAKLISTIAAFAMVLCLTIVGVWAAASVKVNVTGTVTYSTQDVNVKVEGSITGIVGASEKTFTQEWDADDTNGEATWALGDIVFEKNATVVITLKVTNLSTEDNITATLSNQGAASGTNTTAALGATTTATINASASETKNSQEFTFTITVGDWNKAASYTIDLDLDIVKA